MQQQTAAEGAHGNHDGRGLDHPNGGQPRRRRRLGRAMQGPGGITTACAAEAGGQAHHDWIGDHRGDGCPQAAASPVDQLTHRPFAEAQLRGQLPPRTTLHGRAKKGESLSLGEHGQVPQHFPDLEAFLDDRVSGHSHRLVLLEGLRRSHAPAQLVECSVMDNPVQPRTGVAYLDTALQRGPCAQQRLLEHILAVPADEAPPVGEQCSSVAIGQKREGQPVAVGREREKTVIRLGSEEKLSRGD